MLSLLTVLLVFAAVGCGKKVTPEDAKKVQPGMTLAQVEAILGSGTKDGSSYEWKTEKGKLRIGFTDGKVSRIEQVGAPSTEFEGIDPKEKARIDAAWAEQKKDADRVAQDRDRINDLNSVYTLLRAATGVEDRLPANEAAAAASPLAKVNNGMDVIRSGRVVVRWGASSSDAVWAYEKDAPTKGGYAVGDKNYPAEKLTVEQLRPFVTR